LSPWWRRRWVPPKRLFLQEPHGVTSKKRPFFILNELCSRACPLWKSDQLHPGLALPHSGSCDPRVIGQHVSIFNKLWRRIGRAVN
jgi:hypothetical protein